ncbi:hypothetical protein PVW53_20910 [Seohaeicola sp. SP36]|uniref:hypothetical protein n=1 Tax=unclassified Seohaeicola TaxID=2641111 RepID=UPI00237AD8CF|nr:MULTISPECIES: hypothetical protein [unclassified Seohaeicola]MDD9709730.1 hypothetical protein [Seohaeicola sp. 4SK31]MDD9737969.1 hypothetical protein [Seohaeicola sp. SP36]
MRSISENYGWCSSWAVWAAEGEKPKSNIGDLTIFDFAAHPDIRKVLHSDYVAVGLNVSGGREFPTFSNFHSPNPRGQDYKLRYAFRNTPMWGCYLTDILKNFPEVSSFKVAEFIRENPSALQPHFDSFKEEVRLLGAENSIFLGLGRLATQLIKKALPDDAKIVQIRHYSDYINREKYRAEVFDILGLKVRNSGLSI